MKDIENTSSEDVKNIFHIAHAYAKESLSESVCPAHLLKALLHKDTGLIEFIEGINKDYYYLLDWANVRIKLLPKASKALPDIAYSKETNAVLNEAEEYREKQNLPVLHPALLLAAIATPGVGFTFEQLKSFPLTPDEILSSINNGQPVKSPNSSAQSKQKSGKNIEKYTINKIREAEEGKILPIVGFDKEIQTLFETLGRKNKPNLLIVGESGVGKTALINAFVQRIVAGEVPDFLKDASVYELDLSLIASEANYKGEIEDRAKKVLNELSDNENTIVVIENIDKIFDKQSLLYGISTLLKREINRNSLRLIASGSVEGFTKYIETDKEFSRLVEKMTLEEPDIQATFRIISGVKNHYETYYNLSINDDVISESIRLSKRYRSEHSLPDSAFDLIDRTLSHIHTMNDISEKEIKTLNEKLQNIAGASESKTEIEIARDLQWLHHEIGNRLSFLLTSRLEQETDFSKIEKTNDKIQYLTNMLEKLGELAQNKSTCIEPSDLSVIVAKQTGVPAGKLQSKERDKLLNAENIIKQRVVGQDHAIKIVLDAIYESRSGLNKKGQPIASVFFLGPTGTGKTELTKALADFLFQDESAIIRFDMSEFMESHSVATMTGAPAGYVGYEEGGLLVNKIRQKPYSIVLFDEIEKAHPDVFNIFLQIMDEGRVHDKLNRIGDFSNALIVFTSNVGSDHIFETFKSGKLPSSDGLKKIMIERKFKPEFLARLTEVIPFSPITEEIVEMIFNIHLKNLVKTLTELNITLKISDETKRQLALSEFSPELGARPILGIIRNKIRRPLSKMIIEGKVKSGNTVELTCKDGKYEWIY